MMTTAAVVPGVVPLIGTTGAGAADGTAPVPPQWCILPAMTAPSPKVPQKDERADRLAAALRENLKRRKAQARAKGEVPKPSGPGRDTDPTTGKPGG